VVLNTTLLGDSGSHVVFCHGLFGQGKNWTAIGKALADEHRVLLLDLPDHGHSPRTDRFDYVEYADQVERLAVVDVAPVPYDHAVEFDGYIAAMKDIDLDALERRDDADAALRHAVPDPMVRGFLLQSLRREGDGWRWLLNLDLLGRDLDLITGWPGDRLAGAAAYEGLVLWVGGENSRYVRPEYAGAMDRWFPRNRRVTVKDAGHWVHSERPEVFLEVLRRFLGQQAQEQA
jgi:pimeloyl-ACP methyl ester carboxylesterase